MKATSAVRCVALFAGCWLITAFIGCSSPHVQQADANGTWSLSQPPSDVGERQLDPLLAKVSQLQVASQEALEAAKLIGTPDYALIEARQYLASAEQLLQDSKTAYTAREYQESWNQLQAADAAFRQAEEAAVRAGLGQLERELAADYERLLNSETRSGHRTTGTVRVSQGSVNLRDGAGMNFQIVGKAQLGDALNVLGEWAEWYRVRTAAGLVGWVSKTLVTQVPGP